MFSAGAALGIERERELWWWWVVRWLGSGLDRIGKVYGEVTLTLGKSKWICDTVTSETNVINSNQFKTYIASNHYVVYSWKLLSQIYASIHPPVEASSLVISAQVYIHKNSFRFQRSRGGLRTLYPIRTSFSKASFVERLTHIRAAFVTLYTPLFRNSFCILWL